MSFLDRPAPEFKDRCQFVQEVCARAPDVFFILFRSLNRNVVVYELNRMKGTRSIDVRNPVSVYWLDIEPSYRRKRRRQGIRHDRERLSAFERRYAYGCQCTVTKNGVFVVTKLSNLRFYVRSINGRPRAFVGSTVVNYGVANVRSIPNPMHLLRMVRSLRLYSSTNTSVQVQII